MSARDPARGRWFRHGGWVLIPAIVVTVLAGFYQLRLVNRARVAPRLGDGSRVETYGFDLDSLTVPREWLAGSGLPKDGIARLDFPTVVPAGEAAHVKMTSSHAKYLVSADRVVGVAWRGMARAYPLRVLTWHEVVNDTLGGLPIAVTYSPHTDAAVVFDRRVAGATLEFGFSGLVYNADLVLYDRAASPRDESLWVQLLARCVAGPRAGMELPVVPFVVDHWGSWRERFPQTTVVRPDPAFVDQYGTEPYGNYYGNDLPPSFPMASSLPEGSRRKEFVLGLVAGGDRGFVPFSTIAGSGTNGVAQGRLGNTLVRIGWRDRPPAMWVDEATEPIVAIPAFAFAWKAMFPDDPSISLSN